MKPIARSQRKLSLAKETLRALSPAELDAAAGAGGDKPTTTVVGGPVPSVDICPTDACSRSPNCIDTTFITTVRETVIGPKY